MDQPCVSPFLILWLRISRVNLWGLDGKWGYANLITNKQVQISFCWKKWVINLGHGDLFLIYFKVYFCFRLTWSGVGCNFLLFSLKEKRDRLQNSSDRSIHVALYMATTAVKHHLLLHHYAINLQNEQHKIGPHGSLKYIGRIEGKADEKNWFQKS